MSTVGENLKKLRKAKKLTLKQLSTLSGVGQSTISDIEVGKAKNPKIETLNKLADALDVNLNKLLSTSVNSLIEASFKRNCSSYENISKYTGLSMSYLMNLSDIIPNEQDYENVKRISTYLGIRDESLLKSLSHQEPPTYDARQDCVESGYIKEEMSLYETGEFESAEAAMQFILKQPAIMGFGGFDTTKMSDDEIIEFANELLNQMKLISYKYKK